MKERNHRVCPVELSGRLDNRFRRWFQNPRKILRPYVAKGMTVLDIGCGPGFFSIDMAHLVGATGRVIALDLQEGMLQKLSKKIAGTELEGRFALQKCEADKLGVSEPVDFILAFYMFHEVADQDGLLDELGSILKPHGRVLIVEPPFHVSQSAFEQMIGKARKAGFALVETPKILFGKAAVLKRADQVLCPEEPKGGDPAP